jgi:hypothetical protein
MISRLKLPAKNISRNFVLAGGGGGRVPDDGLQVLPEDEVGVRARLPGGEQAEHLLPHRLLCHHFRALRRAIHA